MNYSNTQFIKHTYAKENMYSKDKIGIKLKFM